jgi:hypothetical protein
MNAAFCRCGRELQWPEGKVALCRCGTVAEPQTTRERQELREEHRQMLAKLAAKLPDFFIRL